MSTAPVSTGCTVKPAISARPKVVRVNDVVISREAIARETQNHPAGKPIEAWQAAARALAIRELLLQEAHRLGLAAAPATDAEGRRETEDEALIRAVLVQEVKTPKPDDAICRRYFGQNRRRFRSPDLYAAAHILISAAPGDHVARAEARSLAEVILGKIAGHPEAFPALARAHSTCPSREIGGELGQISPGQTVPEFEAALAHMVPGGVHPQPIESRYGFHVIRLDQRIEGCDLPYESVAARIADHLTDRVNRIAARQYVSLLAGRATLEGVVLEGAPSPLLQ